MNKPNIFETLSRYGGTSVENYLTESFVLLLQKIDSRNRTASQSILSSLLGLKSLPNADSPAQLEFRTQVHVAGGIPDIEVRVPGELHAYIEVKHDSSLGPGQLEYYSSVLEQSPEPTKAIVLLTRSRASSAGTALEKDKFHHVCWYEVHRWLSELDSADEFLQYLIHDFLAFLEAKRMSHQQISWEYERGVPALVDFTEMLEAVIGDGAPGRKVTRTAGWSWRGFYLDGEIFLGVRYADPTTLTFENDSGNSPTFKREFRFAEAHFFSLGPGEQFEALAEFLSESLREFAAEGSS